MSAINKNQESNASEERFPGEEELERETPKKVRVREVDFMRIESRFQEGAGLGSFESEVKEKLASVESPRETMIRKEETVQARWHAHRKLSRLLSDAKLTPRQKQAFWLFYLDGFSVREAASRLGIKKSSAHQLKYLMTGKIQAVLGKKLLVSARRAS